ncbi:MAG: efflux RND transporter periplasmic adaptor subunit [Desulfomonilaceae bacterium]
MRNLIRDILMSLCLATLVICFHNAAVSAEPSVLVETCLVEEKTFFEKLVGYGVIQPDPVSVTSINLLRSGIIARVWVRVGQLVDAQAPLFELDTSPATNVQFQLAQSAVEYARENLRQVEELFNRQLATQDQVANARKNLADAEIRLQEQRRLGADQRRETIKAPFAGVVTKVSVSPGDAVGAGANAAALARQDSSVVSFGVEPEDAAHIRPGMPVTMSAVFQPSVTFSGQVREVHAMINPTTRQIDVLVPLKPPTGTHLPLGLAMKAVVKLSQTKSLGVPRDAVMSDQHHSWIFIVRGNRAYKVLVKTGKEDAGVIPISGPVSAGDEVVVVGNYQLKDGMAVRKAAR